MSDAAESKIFSDRSHPEYRPDLKVIVFHYFMKSLTLCTKTWPTPFTSYKTAGQLSGLTMKQEDCNRLHIDTQSEVEEERVVACLENLKVLQ